MESPLLIIHVLKKSLAAQGLIILRQVTDIYSKQNCLKCIKLQLKTFDWGKWLQLLTQNLSWWGIVMTKVVSGSKWRLVCIMEHTARWNHCTVSIIAIHCVEYTPIPDFLPFPQTGLFTQNCQPVAHKLSLVVEDWLACIHQSTFWDTF